MPVNPALSSDVSKIRDDGNHLVWDSSENDSGADLTITSQYLLSGSNLANLATALMLIESFTHLLFTRQLAQPLYVHSFMTKYCIKLSQYVYGYYVKQISSS